MICQRCGLEGAIDIDTGSRCHAEPSECIALLRADRERVRDWNDLLSKKLMLSKAQRHRLKATIKGAPCLICGEASYPCDEPKCWKCEALEGE